MPLDESLFLFVIGVAAGLSGSIAGLASLFSYPALLSVGLPPVSANVTNTVALLGSGVGSALGSRPELHGQGPRLRRLGAIAAVGGATGAGLLLVTPGGSFALMVPWLIGLASAMILLQPRPRFLQTLAHGGDSRGMTIGVFVVTVYGGYFGAAAGVMILALLVAASDVGLPESNALKNVLLMLANAVAAVGFALLADVVWAAVVPLAVGSLIGGRVGPVVVRHGSARLLRTLIGVAGIGLAIKLGIDAYL
ncbi:sulfite exporter TauE/SafE family protein [Nocardioides mesophilus]|uniref:Probable membrane transporter protein n=1 Tax=Nocardioides mesophilus TaxID=433659 RepID=A0A7G9RD75_9ACTN|nr:sulfite exporter TauE/SafE family protein [Nocardioides mesophilus]QNN53550.1 sulfite exporter TauE/SafE family protein [Nocardioides mesophilus]